MKVKMGTNKNWQYDVKCRKCGKITRMHHSSYEQTSRLNFSIWANEHSSFPIKRQCSCDNNMVMFHDIVAFGNILDVF